MNMSREANCLLACFLRATEQLDRDYWRNHPTSELAKQEYHSVKGIPSKRREHEQCNSFLLKRPYPITFDLLTKVVNAFCQEQGGGKLRTIKHDGAFQINFTQTNRMLFIQTSATTPRPEVVVSVVDIDLSSQKMCRAKTWRAPTA